MDTVIASVAKQSRYRHYSVRHVSRPRRCYWIAASATLPRNDDGFTLLEMAMALAVIGLLIGGVLIGRDMIRSAEVQSVISDATRYSQAFSDFREKYHAVPGDFSHATDIWGAANATPSTCWSTIGTGTQTCDGNGDGLLWHNMPDTVQNNYEQFRAWQHLANAGMIDGSYTGVNGPLDPENAIPGTNVPASRLSGAGFNATAIVYSDFPGLANLYYYYDYGNMLQFGGVRNTSNGNVAFPVLTTQEAQDIDQKMDDGLPGNGKVMTYPSSNPEMPHCATTNVASTAKYDMMQSGNQCALLFPLGM